MKIDKENDYVAYNDKDHVYWIKGSDLKCISVTTLIGKYCQPFDSEFWSTYKALEKIMGFRFKEVKGDLISKKAKVTAGFLKNYNIELSKFLETKQNILKEWEKNKNNACETGTRIHAKQEGSALDGSHEYIKKFYNGGKFKAITDNRIMPGIECHYPELLLSYISPDKSLRIAGQADLVMIDKDMNIIIHDYKGLPLDTKIPTPNGWSTIENLNEGDYIFDKDGNQTKILHKSKIHYNKCYKITFDNNDSIIADHEHRWLISFLKEKQKNYKRYMIFEDCVMTTEEIYNYLKKINKKESSLIPKILNPKPLNCNEVNLPIDPYVLGVWLGDGSKACGIVTQHKNSKIWEEIKRRGYSVGENAQHNPNRENTEMRTIYNLSPELRKLNLINNKHIPDIYQRSSYKQRLDLLRGLMDTDGYYNNTRKRFVMSTGSEWQKNDMVKLLATFGIKTTVFQLQKKCNDKKCNAWDVCFTTNEFNPFLTRNQDIVVNLKSNNRSFRNIKSVELVDTIPTQCLEVDSPSHTFLCTESMIVTHNTNSSIDKNSYFNKITKKHQMMQYPLGHIQDSNYWHYALQLSVYGWMIKQLYPEAKIKDMRLIHIDRNTEKVLQEYEVPYLEKEVVSLLKDYKQKNVIKTAYDKIKPIEY